MPELGEEFATQVDASILAQLRDLTEGRQIQAPIDEALADL